jgi:predicted ATPase/DNA-binding SARP family transcriptional activator
VAAEGLRVRSLGGFAVWRGAEQIPADLWTRRKLLASLFKQLLCADGWRLPREHLMDSLWPSAEPATATKNLRYTVFLLRRMLDIPDATSSYLRWEGELLALRPALDGEPAEDWLDALAFARAARRALAGSSSEACAAALQLYGGEFLPDDLYDEWAEQQRADLRRQFVALLVHQATLCEQRGDLAQAIACLHRVLETDLCHEASARALMRIHAAAGRYLEAIRVYQQLAEVLQRDLSLRPDKETQALYAQALAGRQTGNRQHTNLPSPLTSFVGRSRELKTLSHLLAAVPAADQAATGDPPRLVTIAGSGGCGKTRLAIQLGHSLRDRYADGIRLIELAGLIPDQDMDPALIAQQACTALSIKPVPGQSPLVTLCDWFGPRHALLILDNCEHVLAGCVQLTAALLGAAPRLQVLATSRQALGMLGETVWRLPSLAVPSDAGASDLPLPELARLSSVRLFLERGRAVRPGFTLTAGNRRAVAEVCRRLDGIPLAIELAAARLAVLSVEELAVRLADRFRLLVAGNGAALPRHRTLGAVIAWSYQLLTPPEQVALRALAVFSGGWTLDAAERLCVGLDTGGEDTLDLLGQLVSKSLVQVDDGADTTASQTRYRFLETIRQYAMDQARTRGEETDLRDRHARWCMELVEQEVPQSGQPARLARIAAEYDNLRSALQWCLREAGERELGLRLACALGPFWLMRSRYREGRFWVEEALAQVPSGPDLLRAKALTFAGHMAYWLGDHVRTEQAYEESLALRRPLGAAGGVGHALTNVGNMALERGDFTRARALFEEGLRLLEMSGDRPGMARVLNNLGVLATAEGDVAQALERYEQCCRMWRELGDTWSLATQISNVGYAACALGMLERSRSCYVESLKMRRELDDRDGAVWTLRGMGYLAHQQGDDALAARLLGAATALAEELGATPTATAWVDHKRYLAEIREALDADAFAARWAEGQAMTSEQAVEHALAVFSPDA